MALHRALIEIGREVFQRLILSIALWLFACLVFDFLSFIRNLGDAVRNIVDNIEPTDALLAQQVDSL